MGSINLSAMLMNTVNLGENSSSNQVNQRVSRASTGFEQTFNQAKRINETREARAINNSASDSVKEDPGTREKQQVKSDTVEKDSSQAKKHKVEDETVDEGCIQEAEDARKCAVENEILALVSQLLNTSIEEVTGLLNQLGLEAQDLMGREGFSKFIGEALGNGNVDMLLMADNNLSDVTKLFDTLTQLGETEGVSSMVHPMTDNEQGAVNKQLALLNQSSEIDVYTTGDQDVESGIHNQTKEVIGVRQESKQEGEEGLSFLQGNEVQGEDLGSEIPVHHFTSTSFTQAFATDNGSVLQSVTTHMRATGNNMIEQIEFKVLSELKELNVQLSPKELGNMSIKIVENSGVLVAEIKVENEKTKALLLSEIEMLKERLEGEGLNVAEVKVDIGQGDKHSQMEQEKQKSSKRIQEIINKHLNEIEEDEGIEQRPMDMDSEVDYMV